MWDEANEPAQSQSSRHRRVDLSGQWYAIWQTTAEGLPNINSELVTLTQHGASLVLENVARSPENPLGGYLWRGEADLVDNQYLIGAYAATERRVSSKGTLFFIVSRSGTYLVGKWVGCNLDSNFSWGFGVLAQDKEAGLEKLRILLNEQVEFSHGPKRANGSDYLSPGRQPGPGDSHE
jgi:hypothetical protein